MIVALRLLFEIGHLILPSKQLSVELESPTRLRVRQAAQSHTNAYYPAHKSNYSNIAITQSTLTNVL